MVLQSGSYFHRGRLARTSCLPRNRFPQKIKTRCYLPFHVDVGHLFAGEEGIVLQHDVVRVPDHHAQLVRLRLAGRDVDRWPRQRHIHREHVDPHLQLALLDARLVAVVQRPRLDVLRHDLWSKVEDMAVRFGMFASC